MLIVEQQIEWLETFTDYETENRYAILNKHGDEQLPLLLGLVVLVSRRKILNK